MTNDPVTRDEKKMPVVLAKLREEAKISRIQRSGDPFQVNSGQFERGR